LTGAQRACIDARVTRLVLIAGPTASGKSALALRVAERLGGTVVNADSMQVYRDLRVISARPTPEEEARAVHRLYGHVDGAVNYSVGMWLRDVEAVLADLAARGQAAIVTGGTGLYFKALTQGLSDIPPVPEEVRARVRLQAEGQSSEALHAGLAARDPEMAARLRPSDRQRTLRALEVFEATGRPLAAFHGSRRPPLVDPGACERVFLAPERGALFARIDARFETMMGEGALEEAAALRARGLDPALPVMRAHGVPHLIGHLEGRMTREEAIARAQADTRHYAKRQFTWFRHQMPGWDWLTPEEAAARLPA
jgi:tRNA dimethylallyltransferase